MKTSKIEFLSDLTRTYTTFVVGAGAIGYYISAILINSILYVIYIELIYISFWLIIMNWEEKK